MGGGGRAKVKQGLSNDKRRESRQGGAFDGGAVAGGVIGGAAGAVSGYSNARRSGRGVISSAAHGALKGAGGAVIGGALGGVAGNFGVSHVVNKPGIKKITAKP